MIAPKQVKMTYYHIAAPVIFSLLNFIQNCNIRDKISHEKFNNMSYFVERKLIHIYYQVKVPKW